MVEEHDTLEVMIWRGDASGGDFARYEVPTQESQTILDVVTWIQRHAEPGLAYRFACRVGMCGSCAMMVNGLPRWTCRTHVKKATKDGTLRIEPLRNMPVIRDLACDMSEFFEKWVKAEGVFEPSATRTDDFAPIKPGAPDRAAANAAIECINCGVCYAACDTVSANADYLGPAALNRAWSLLNDRRDTGQEKRLAAISTVGGCHNCHTHQSCAALCPNLLNPTASIAGLKRETVKSALGMSRKR